MQVTLNISGLNEYALAQIVKDVNHARPLDSDGTPVGVEMTVESYVQERWAAIMLDYCRAKARISGAAFIDRFTASEWAALKAARAASPQLAAAAAPLLQGQRVELAGPLAQQGIGLLRQLGILTADRAAAMLAPPAEGEAA